jgi:hypothetical protein
MILQLTPFRAGPINDNDARFGDDDVIGAIHVG